MRWFPICLVVLSGFVLAILVSFTSLSSAVAHDLQCPEAVSSSKQTGVLYCDCTWTFSGNKHWGLWVGGENWGFCDVWVICTPPE